tara:strand:+ start:2664 stop:3815 length:1152 start_codon:yes stop_codon:yes gene_type:complete
MPTSAWPLNTKVKKKYLSPTNSPLSSIEKQSALFYKQSSNMRRNTSSMRAAKKARVKWESINDNLKEFEDTKIDFYQFFYDTINEISKYFGSDDSSSRDNSTPSDADISELEDLHIKASKITLFAHGFKETTIRKEASLVRAVSELEVDDDTTKEIDNIILQACGNLQDFSTLINTIIDNVIENQNFAAKFVIKNLVSSLGIRKLLDSIPPTNTTLNKEEIIKYIEKILNSIKSANAQSKILTSLGVDVLLIRKLKETSDKYESYCSDNDKKDLNDTKLIELIECIFDLIINFIVDLVGCSKAEKKQIEIDNLNSSFEIYKNWCEFLKKNSMNSDKCIENYEIVNNCLGKKGGNKIKKKYVKKDKISKLNIYINNNTKKISKT